MAERYDFYVHDNRKITFNLTEPIMREDSGVTDFVFHIPKILNELEVSDWQWWLVFVNAKKEKYSIALELSDDPESPLEKNVATYTVDYAMSIKAGSVQFALEAINAGTGGAIDNEWHTLTYETKVKDTLQGNQAEYAETESDIISALLEEVRIKVNQLVGGATPPPVNLKSLMTDHDNVYLYTGSETGESTGYWYHWNGTDFVPGGLYASGLTIDPTFTVRGSVADAKMTGDALASKIAKPPTSPNGTNGQLLRTLGNGQTEWTDFATPTTEQVGGAVENWLDDHPEATTTVQNWSLTADKFVKGQLGCVTLEMFGAVGDGVTDDTQAISDAIDYAIENGVPIFLHEKTYILNSAVINKALDAGQSLYMYGCGERSVIKRKPDSLVHKFSTLIVIGLAETMSASACDVSFYNFKIDSNRRGQSMATDDYTYEASADIMFNTGSDSPTTRYINRVVVDKMMFYDAVADNLSFSGVDKCNVKNVFVSNIVCQRRDGTRNDIGITGNPLGDVYITNVFCDSIHFEFNSDQSESDINTVFVDGFDCNEFTISGDVNINAKHIKCKKAFMLALGKGKGRFSDCEIILHPVHYSYIIHTNAVFTNCDFISNLNTDGNACTTLTLRETMTRFNGCRFIYDGILTIDTDSDTVADRIEGSPINFFYTASATNTVTVFDNCDIDEKFNIGLICKNAGTVYVSNMTFNTTYPIQIETSLANAVMALHLSNIILGSKCKYTFKIHAIKDSSTVSIDGDMVVTTDNVEINFNTTTARTSFTAYVSAINFKRKCEITTPLTEAYIYTLYRYTTNNKYIYLFNGDVFEYRGSNQAAYPDRWRVMNNGLTHTTNSTTHDDGQLPLVDRIKSEGSGAGASTARPSCYLSKGFRFFDTTLGKPIFWNGTTWVDSTGTTV